MTFIDFDVCNLAATLLVLYSVTLTYFFKVKYFKCQYLEKVKAREKCSSMKFIQIDICHRT